RTGLRFVRVPDQKRTYVVRMDVALSTIFADWIETDLMEVTRAEINGVNINDYSIDERTGRVNDRDRLVLAGDDRGWTADGIRSSQQVDSTTMQELLQALDDLSIVGVRLKPTGLSQSLISGNEGELARADIMSLQSKGFFVSKEGQLLSNEGEMEVHTAKGVVYTLRFGEVLFGAGTAITAGSGETGSGNEGGSENRYLFLTTRFDENAFRQPRRPSDTTYRSKPDSLLTDSERIDKQAGQTYDTWQRNVEQGRSLSGRLNQRYSDWYYVISADSFDQLRLRRSDLIVAKD
ncbi:MAG: DUF4340 domain-containing protein, partial [candidate division Zixibacteria bacterium]